MDGGGLGSAKLAREPASSRSKPSPSLKNWRRILARSPLLDGSRMKETYPGQRSAFPSETYRFAPLILAHKGSALPWLVDDRPALHPHRIWRLTHPIERATVRLRVMRRPIRLSATGPSGSRVPPPSEGHQIGLGKRRIGWTPTSTAQTAAAAPQPISAKMRR